MTKNPKTRAQVRRRNIVDLEKCGVPQILYCKSSTSGNFIIWNGYNQHFTSDSE